MAYPDKDRYIPNKGTAGHSSWQEGDYVTAANMNHIEDGIDQAVQNAEAYADDAVNTVKFISDNTAPTTSTVGTVGQKYLYINGSTKIIYECVDASDPYKWEILYRYNADEEKWYRTDTDGDSIDISTIIGSIADAYDNATLYSKGAVVSYNEKLYRAKADTSGHTPTDTTYWEETNIADLIDRKADVDGHYPSMIVGLAEGIESDRVIEDADVSCPPITFGTTGGDAEIQTGNNKFKFLYGKSKKWNQYAKNLSTTNWTTGNGATLSVADGIGTYSSSSQWGRMYHSISSGEIVKGHKYLLTATIKPTASITGNLVLYAGSSSAVGSQGTHLSLNVSETSVWTTRSTIAEFTGTTTSNEIGIMQLAAVQTDFQVKNIMLIDLTAIYGVGNEPTTVADFKKDYPLDYYAYNQSTILSAKSSELVSVGENQWDEQWEVGTINFTTGAKENASTVIRSKNYIRVLKDTEYYFSLDDTSAIMFIFAYDANYNYIGCYQGNNTWGTSYEGVQNTAIKMPENAEYLLFRCSQQYGTTYKNDINIYICWDTPGRPYVAHREDHVTLSNIELRSIPDYTNGGEIRDEAYQTGGGKRYVGLVDLGTLDYEYENYPDRSPRFKTLSLQEVIKGVSSNTEKGNILCSTYENVSYTNDLNINTNKNMLIALSITGNIFIINNNYTDAATFKTAMSGVYLLYELATPTDIPTIENPGWTELVYTDNYGTLQFLTNPTQIPQVPQPYYIEYTVSLVDFLDATYAHADGDAENLALKQDVDDIVDGNTPAGKALLADNLESSNKIEDLLPYTMRQSPSGVAKSMELDHITGGTVAWNQTVQNGNFVSAAKWQTNNCSLSVSNNVATLTVSTPGSVFGIGNTDIYTTSGHKNLIICQAKATAGRTIFISGLSANKTATATGQWQTVAYVETAQNMLGVYPRFGLDTNNTSGETLQLKNIQCFDLTQMFGSTIANYLYNQGDAGVNKFRNLFPNSYYPYNAGELVGVKTAGRKAIGVNIINGNFVKCTYNDTTGALTPTPVGSGSLLGEIEYYRIIPNAQYYGYAGGYQIYGYFYDKDKNYIAGGGNSIKGIFTTPSNAYYIRCYLGSAYGTTYKNDVCINISDPTINGTFYPYEADEYPCEEVELNGLYELDSNNNLIADGDEYKNDGTVTRRYGVVDLGNLTWTKGSAYFSAPFVSVYGAKQPTTSETPKLVCAKQMMPKSQGGVSGQAGTYEAYITQTGGLTWYYPLEGFADGNAFKTAMSGVMLVYELATPTSEETASSFASTQKTGVTEQFMEPETPSTVFLPVGHDSFYLPDLKDKLEVAPDSPTTDGVYVVSRSGGTNVYIPIANVTATQAEIDEIIAILE